MGHRDQKVGLYYWLSAAALAVALMAGSDLIQGIALYVKWTLFIGGLLLAVALFLVAAVTAFREEQAAPAPNRKPMLALVGMLVFGAGFLGCAAWFFWPTAGHESESVKTIRAPDLVTLFMTDFHMKFTGVTTNWSKDIDIGEGKFKTRIFYNLCYDFGTHSKFILAYFPPSPYLTELSHFIADNAPSFFEEDNERMPFSLKQGGESQIEKPQELMFSGRIYIYTPDLFDISFLADELKYFKEKGMAVQFRGTEYEYSVKQNVEAGRVKIPAYYEIKDGIINKIN